MPRHIVFTNIRLTQGEISEKRHMVKLICIQKVRPCASCETLAKRRVVMTVLGAGAYADYYMAGG